jgi:hypothetical protein
MVAAAAQIAGQEKKRVNPDLAALAASGGLRVFNRTVGGLGDVAKAIRLSEGPGNGVAYVPGVEFANGTIECEIRGKDLAQRSFVGVAFHGVDATTWDAVYFRPFNFNATQPPGRPHQVQYVSHPTYSWEKLRTEHPGKYEKPVNPVPDPNTWFHARIVVASPSVSVFVGDAKEPSLVVDQLSDRRSGLVGVWVGNQSGGDFANLQITPA